MNCKRWVKNCLGLSLGDLVNIVVLIVSILALFVAISSLNVSIESLKSAEKSGSDQQKVLDASRKSLEMAVDKLKLQTQLQLKQYSSTVKSSAQQQKVLETSRKSLQALVAKLDVQTQLQVKQYKNSLLKPKVNVYFWDPKKRKQILPNEYQYNEKTKSLGIGRRSMTVERIELNTASDGKTYFDLIIENIGEKDLVDANINIDCNVPIETYSSGVSGQSEHLSLDPNIVSWWNINFTNKILKANRGMLNSITYRFSTAGPFPKGPDIPGVVFLPQKTFGCFVDIAAPSLEPSITGAFFEAKD